MSAIHACSAQRQRAAQCRASVTQITMSNAMCSDGA
jgi:hypothetical protein